MGMKDELKDMFDALESGAGEPEPTDAPATDAPVDNKTEPPSTDEPTTDEPETDAPETKAPKTEPPATEPPEGDELARFRSENEELKRRLDELERAPKTKTPSTKAPTTDPPIEDEDFIGEMDLSDSDVDPKELNKVLNTIYKKAIQRARDEGKRASEALLREVPRRVTEDMSAQEKLQKLTENFYKDNDDLRQFPKAVAAVFDELVESNPNKKADEVLTMVADETRKRLGLKKPARSGDKNDNKDKDNPPPLHRPKGRRSQTQDKETSGVAKEIDAMNESLNR